MNVSFQKRSKPQKKNNTIKLLLKEFFKLQTLQDIYTLFRKKNFVKDIENDKINQNKCKFL